MSFSSESNGSSNISRDNGSADISYIRKCFAEVERLFREVVIVESRITTRNYDVEVSGLFAAREKYVGGVERLKEALEEVDDLPAELFEVFDYVGTVDGEGKVNIAYLKESHLLVGLRVRLIEAWFALKKVDEGHALYFERRQFFLDVLEESVRKLRNPMSFSQMYELYAEDLAKLRSLVESYFMKRSQSFYIKEFNKAIVGEGKSKLEMALVLKEFSIFVLYKTF